MKENLVGKRFERLIVIKKDEKSKDNKNSSWICKCDCDKIVTVTRPNLRSGNTKSCGCMFNRISVVRHGLYEHDLYSVWEGIKARCQNQNNTSFNSYGGRGIKICKEWQNNFKLFFHWAIQNGWKSGLQIDRIDNDKGYMSSNCRFVTPRKNVCNRRDKFKSRYGIGVRKYGKRFYSLIYIYNRPKYLGMFDTPKEASLQRDLVLREFDWTLQKQKERIHQ